MNVVNNSTYLGWLRCGLNDLMHVNYKVCITHVEYTYMSSESELLVMLLQSYGI